MSLTEKAKIIALAEQNVSNREIAFKTSFNESSVRRFLKKYCETEKLEKTKGSGSKKCTNERENRVIMKTSLWDRFKNAVEIASEVQQRFFKDGFDGKDTSQKTTSQPENEESSLKLGEK